MSLENQNLRRVEKLRRKIRMMGSTSSKTNKLDRILEQAEEGKLEVNFKANSMVVGRKTGKFRYGKPDPGVYLPLKIRVSESLSKVTVIEEVKLSNTEIHELKREIPFKDIVAVIKVEPASMRGVKIVTPPKEDTGDKEKPVGPPPPPPDV